jgi:methionyl-tRNA formyltransferase
LALVFLGTSEFAAGVLARLAAGPHRPALVLTRPDRPRGRGRRVAPPPVAARARELGLALAQPERINDADARELIARAGGDDAAGPRTVVVCAFGALITEPLLSEHELVNVHPSLLPRWRGAAPIERAIMAGDARTGVSIMRLTAGLDSGPVARAASEPIRVDDDYGSLSARLVDLAGGLLGDVLSERPSFVEQPEDGVTYAEKITTADRTIDPSRTAAELERTVRALHPHIGARAELPDGTMLGVHRARIVAPGDGGASATGEAGVTAADGRLLLRCGDGTLELLEVRPPGGRAMDAAAYLRGHAAAGRR